MTNEVHKLLQEFSIRMNDRPERPEEEDDEFDFNLSGDDEDRYDTDDEFISREYGAPDEEETEFGNMDFDQDELEFGDFERGEEEDEFGNFGSSDFPDGLDDMDDEAGEFAGERKVDITDRLKKLLARRGETGDEPDPETRSPELNLSDVDDLSNPTRSSRQMRGHDDMDTPERLGRFRNERMGRRDRGRAPAPEFPNRRER